MLFSRDGVVAVFYFGMGGLVIKNCQLSIFNCPFISVAEKMYFLNCIILSIKVTIVATVVWVWKNAVESQSLISAPMATEKRRGVSSSYPSSLRRLKKCRYCGSRTIASRSMT